MHCASLGEFEQGRPVLEKIKKNYPTYTIVLTFFSPSGYEIRKNYKGADFVYYLPVDSKFNAGSFIDSIQPSLVIWVKYEFWYYYLTTLRQKNIPVILIAGIFREGQPFFKWYGKIWREMLNCFHTIFVQNESSRDLLKKAGFTSYIITGGDTRFDRVIEISEMAEPLPQGILQFCNGKKVLVAGSTWPDDEKALLHYTRVHPEIKFIIAPHEIQKENLLSIQKYFGDPVFYSKLHENPDLAGKHVLVIDNIGLLSRLYKLANITYIGGGFGSDGIHNVLEAAVYGKPVVFGPVYEKFAEARDLVERGGAFSIQNAVELETLLDKLFTNAAAINESGKQAGNYVLQQRGATGVILDYIEEKRLLTS